MREKLRALYYPEFWFEYPTLVKCILLFDEIHLMDRPSFTFDGRLGMMGQVSPMRQYEQSFRDEGVPLYVHPAPGGIVEGEMLEAVDADLSDRNYMSRFQEGLRASTHFRNLHISPGNYGNGETHETIFEKVTAIDLERSPSVVITFHDPGLRPFDFARPEGCLKTLASKAAFCSAKMNFALKVGARHGFSPLADASPYAGLLSAKYSRAVPEMQILATDLSLAVLDELVSPEALSKIQLGDAIKYRKESESAREAFLEHLLALQAKLGGIPQDADYDTTINKIMTTEIQPAAREFRSKLRTVYEKLFGKLVGGTIVWMASSAAVQFFGDITWQKLLATGAAVGAYVAPKAVDALVETRALRRDCAFSYLLDLETKK